MNDILPTGLVNPTENSLEKEEGTFDSEERIDGEKRRAQLCVSGRCASSIPGMALNRVNRAC